MMFPSYLSNHGIDPNLIARTESIARTFFAQPEAYLLGPPDPRPSAHGAPPRLGAPG